MPSKSILERQYFIDLINEIKDKYGIIEARINEGLGITQITLLGYKKGITLRMPLSILDKIATLYDVDFYDLVEYELDYERKRQVKAELLKSEKKGA